MMSCRRRMGGRVDFNGIGRRRSGTAASPERWAVLADLVAVLVFVAIGLSAHGHHESLGNLTQVSAPFLVGALVGHLLVRLRGAQAASPAGGVVVVVATVAIGQVLRVIFGQGTAVSFIAVSLGFNTFIMLGWRFAWSVLRRGALTSRGS